METPISFDLNEAIRRWQQELAASPAFCADNLEELASHLRASVQKLKADGLSEEEAFQIAARRIGQRGSLEREFAKVNTTPAWSLPVISFWIVASLYLFQVAYSLTGGILTRRIISELGVNQRLNANPYLRNEVFSWCFYPLAPLLGIVMAWVLLLCARLATGNWKRTGAIIRIFEHPILAGLCLVVLGHAAILMPILSPAFDAALCWDYLARSPVINDVLVLLMVLLARRALRKTSPPDGKSSQNYGNPNPI